MLRKRWQQGKRVTPMAEASAALALDMSAGAWKNAMSAKTDMYKRSLLRFGGFPVHHPAQQHSSLMLHDESRHLLITCVKRHYLVHIAKGINEDWRRPGWLPAMRFRVLTASLHARSSPVEVHSSTISCSAVEASCSCCFRSAAPLFTNPI